MTIKRVTFKGDSENLMKPPCETIIFQIDDMPKDLGKNNTNDIEDIAIQLKKSKNPWRPKFRR